MICQIEEKAMQQITNRKVRKHMQHRGQRKKTKGKDKKREDNAETKIIVKTIGRVTWIIIIIQLFCVYISESAAVAA